MKLVFAAATAAVFFTAAPSYAVSVVSVCQSQAGDCFQSAAETTRMEVSDIRLQKGIAGCNLALAGDISQVSRAGTLINRAMLQAAAGRDEAAIADYTAGLALNPRQAKGYLNRGMLYLANGRYDDARADFDHAIALNVADLHIAYFNRGEAEEASGNIVAAYRDYLRAQVLAPDFQPAQTELARFHVVRRLASKS